MRQDDRAPFDRALHRARLAAYSSGEFVGQESFMTAGEIRALALQAGIGPGVAVLDLCCGIAGPGRLITRELDCDYLGLDASASAVAIARERAAGLPCRFAVAQVPPLPAGAFDVVLLLETMLAFADKDALVRAVAAALRPGGRFAFTFEEGPPLTRSERAAMPDAETVRLTPLDDLTASLERAGLALTCVEDHSRAHRATAQALMDAFAADAAEIAAQVGRRALDELIAAHRLWVEWLDAGRVRKLAIVTERPRSSVERQRPVGEREAEPDDRERDDEDDAFDRVAARAAEVPQDQGPRDDDEPEFDVQRRGAPEAVVTGKRAARGDQHRERRQGGPAEAAGDRAQLLAVGAAQRGDDRDRQDELAADEQRHREHVQPADGEPPGAHAVRV